MKKIICILALLSSVAVFSEETPPPVTKVNTTVESVNLTISHSGLLTQDQKSSLNDLVKDFEREQSGLELGIREINLKIEKELLSDNPNLKIINKLIDEKSELIAQMEKNTFDARFKAEDILM